MRPSRHRYFPCRRTILTVLCLMLLLPLPESRATGWDGEFEQLHFRLSWLFVHAGTAVIQAAPQEDGGAEYRIDSCSTPALDLIYKVRDQILARTRLNDGHQASAHYRFQQNEARRQEDTEIVFSEDSTATVTDHRKGETTTFVLASGTLDMVTAFFAIRALPLAADGDYRLPVFDKTTSYDLVIDVVRREVRDTALGKATPLVVIHPRLQTDGIFKRKSDMHIWLTDDAQHIPVRMESKVTVGKIIAALERVEREPPALDPKQLACASIKGSEY